MRVRLLSCADRKLRCSEASEVQIYRHLFLGGNMPEISKGCPVCNAWFDENTDESKVIADRDTLIFWWRQIFFFSWYSQPNLCSLPMRAGFFLLLILWSFEQLPGLYGPVWHPRKMSFPQAACRLFVSLFVTGKSPVPFGSLQPACRLPALYCSPSSSGFHLPHVLQQAACLHARVKQPAFLLASCSLLNCP